jgi:hypothetical protein
MANKSCSPTHHGQGNQQLVKWSGIQSILEEAESDVLILLGCCASLAMSSEGGRGVTDVVAACAFETPNTSKPFTSALSQALTELYSESQPFTVAMLYSRLLLYQQKQWYMDRTSLQMTPVHISLTKDHGSSRSIFISPLKLPKAYGTMLPLDLRAASESRVSLSASPISATQSKWPTKQTVPEKRLSSQTPFMYPGFGESSIRTTSPFEVASIHNKSGSSSTAAKKQKRDFRFQCTSLNCHQTFGSLSDWRRHESQVHWLMLKWECQICKETGSWISKEHGQWGSFSFSRKDKLMMHVREKHGDGHFDIDSWSREVDADWPRVCGFCGAQFESWNDRSTHVGRHFSDGLKIQDWKIPWRSENRELEENTHDDDNDDQNV